MWLRWLARFAHIEEVGGSSPSIPTKQERVPSAPSLVCVGIKGLEAALRNRNSVAISAAGFLHRASAKRSERARDSICKKEPLHPFLLVGCSKGLEAALRNRNSVAISAAGFLHRASAKRSEQARDSICKKEPLLVGADFISFAAAFIESHFSLIPSLLLSAKDHACFSCLFARLLKKPLRTSDGSAALPLFCGFCICKLHIVRSRASVRAHSFRCSSSPQKTAFASPACLQGF